MPTLTYAQRHDLQRLCDRHRWGDADGIGNRTKIALQRMGLVELKWQRDKTGYLYHRWRATPEGRAFFKQAHT